MTCAFVDVRVATSALNVQKYSEGRIRVVFPVNGFSTSLRNVGNCLTNCKFFFLHRIMCTPAQTLSLCTGRTARKGSRGIALLFLDHGTRKGEGSASRPGLSLPPGKTRYPLYRRLGGSQGRSGQVRKISPPPGFDPRTVQPVASRYATLRYPAHTSNNVVVFIFLHSIALYSFNLNILHRSC